MTSVIRNFGGVHAWASNFAASKIYWDGEWWETVEHAYQAAKTNDQMEREAIRKAATPGHAKRLGRKVAMREDWDEIKFSVMRELLEIKFQDPYLREQLLSTAGTKLVEGNTWHDNIWGDCDCLGCSRVLGQNHLGLMLMDIRDTLLKTH